MRAIVAALLLVGCAAPQRRALALDLVPQLTIESPTPGLLVHAPEVDVTGRFHTDDGKAWVWVESTQAELDGDRFVARRVPLREGKMDLRVELTDGRGRKRVMMVPIVVETHDRPRSSKLCEARGCVRYETRGVPQRDARGEITNAVVVLSAFGFDERLDELWPDLVGPGRALDSRRRFIVGVAPPDVHAPEDAEALVSALVGQLGLARSTPLVGASSFGAELVLRLVAHQPLLTGPVLVCGGHDEPYLEPPVREVYKSSIADSRSAIDHWRDIARTMVAASYTEAYLADPSHAVEHGLVEETKAVGLARALADKQAAYFDQRMPLATLHERMESAMALEHAPLVFEKTTGRLVVLVANRLDRMMRVERVEGLARRLRTAGARLELELFDDPLGHSAFFRHVPAALERGVAVLLGGRP